VLIGASQHLNDKRGKAAASSTPGSLVAIRFAPVAPNADPDARMDGAMWSLAVITVGALPLGCGDSGRSVRGGAGAVGLRRGRPCRMRSKIAAICCCTRFYVRFHIAFLVTHLPGEVNLCGCRRQWRVGRWPSSASPTSRYLIAGWCTQRFAAIHSCRDVRLARAVDRLYLLEPRTKWTFYAFAVAWTHVAGHRAPTATIVGKLFGIRYCPRLFGSHCSHTDRCFLALISAGCAVRFGDYQWIGTQIGPGGCRRGHQFADSRG